MYFARTPSVLLLMGLVATLACAQSDEAPPVQANFAYSTRSVFRGVERAGNSFQAGIELTRDNLHGAIRISQPFGGDSASEATLQAGYRWVASDRLTLEASFAHTWFSDVPGDEVKRSLEAGLAATFAPVAGFTPGLRYFHDFRFLADTGEISLRRSVALTKLGAFLEFNLFGGWASGHNWRPDAAGPRRADDYGYWGGEVSLPYRIGGQATLVAGLHYTEASGRSPINGPFGSSRQPGTWATLGVNLDF
jgi:hypothetical protein